ncbi:hypothetical protein FHS42_003588 [Streptomyces zagrosensis]|uniref:Uncharacterized protein n=1 Tax=Streptomyces zagrosensis TaxID=1042984 RepID=A0A7W9UZ14_9ACTN|nr:hypothetical protein [Streptomyces zagrosensis]
MVLVAYRQVGRVAWFSANSRFRANSKRTLTRGPSREGEVSSRPTTRPPRRRDRHLLGRRVRVAAEFPPAQLHLAKTPVLREAGTWAGLTLTALAAAPVGWGILRAHRVTDSTTSSPTAEADGVGSRVGPSSSAPHRRAWAPLRPRVRATARPDRDTAPALHAITHAWLTPRCPPHAGPPDRPGSAGLPYRRPPWALATKTPYATSTRGGCSGTRPCGPETTPCADRGRAHAEG